MPTEATVSLTIEQLRQLRDTPSEIARRLPDIMNALRGEDEEVRAWAGDVLDAAPPLSAEQCVSLAETCRDSQAAVAGWTCRLLGKQEAVASICQADLVACMQSHPVVSVQQQAAVALGQIPNLNAQTVEALRQAASSEDPRLSRMARAAVEKAELNQ